MSKIMRATIATVGIVLIGSAVGGFVRIWTRKAIFSASAVATLTFFHPQEDRPPKWNWHAPPEQPPEISTNVTVNWPTSAYTNESFTIQLIATNPEQGQQFLLSGAGLQIDPTTWLPLTRSSNPKQGTAQGTGRGTASGI